MNEQYIKMCDCSEIQKKWKRHLIQFGYCFVKPLTRSYYPLHYAETSVGTFLYFSQTLRNFEKSECVWLPSEENLWEILPFTGQSITLERFGLHMWITAKELSTKKDDALYESMFETAQQALLSRIMLELHNKTWSGEIWYDKYK